MGPAEELEAIRGLLGDLPERMAAVLSPQRGDNGRFLPRGAPPANAPKPNAASQGGLLGALNTLFRIEQIFKQLGDLGWISRPAPPQRPAAPTPAQPLAGPPKPAPQPVQPGLPAPPTGPTPAAPLPPIAPRPTPTPPTPTGGPTPPVQPAAPATTPKEWFDAKVAALAPKPWINTLGPPPNRSPAAFPSPTTAPRPMTPAPIAPAGPGAGRPTASAPSQGGSQQADKSTEAIEDLEETSEKLMRAVEKLTGVMERLIRKMESRDLNRPRTNTGPLSTGGTRSPIHGGEVGGNPGIPFGKIMEAFGGAAE